MMSTADFKVITLERDEAFLPPVSPELLAARAAKRDYIACLIVAMLTPVIMLIVAAMVS